MIFILQDVYTQISRKEVSSGSQLKLEIEILLFIVFLILF